MRKATLPSSTLAALLLSVVAATMAPLAPNAVPTVAREEGISLEHITPFLVIRSLEMKVCRVRFAFNAAGVGGAPGVGPLSAAEAAQVATSMRAATDTGLPQGHSERRGDFAWIWGDLCTALLKN